MTGPSTIDSQAKVLSLLQRGQLNAAFQQALSASDLNIVVMACEKTDPARVFCAGNLEGDPKCVLQQPVLLSLIQQLSANLGHRTELKHRYVNKKKKTFSFVNNCYGFYINKKFSDGWKKRSLV